MSASARDVALWVIAQVGETKEKSSYVLNRAHSTFSLSPQDRSLVTELSYGVLRWRLTLDECIRRSSRYPLDRMSVAVLNIIRMGVYQLLFLDRVPDYAVIDEAVRAVQKEKNKKTAGFVNAVLRNIQRQRSDIQSRLQVNEKQKYTSQEIAFKTAHPIWMIDLWKKEVGEERAIKIAIQNNKRPDLCLRVNTLRISRDELFNRLKKEFSHISFYKTNYSDQGIRVEGGGEILRSDLFQKGYLTVQEEVSQLVGQAVSPQPGETVLDTCAAPGGKTTHLAELMKDRGKILSIDKTSDKTSLIKGAVHRLGLASVEVREEDLLRTEMPSSFDKVLVDAPCSALGNIRHCPEIKWDRKPSDVSTLQAIQMKLLSKAALMVRSPGALVYSVCTFTPEETDEVISLFLKIHPSWSLEDLAPFLPSRCAPLIRPNGTLLHEGFFLSRLKNK